MAEQIATALRQAIASGKLRPGTRLLEVQIAREMGASRVMGEHMGEVLDLFLTKLMRKELRG